MKTIMRITILGFAIICAVCNNHVKQTADFDERLIGTWYSDLNDAKTEKTVGDVTMTFTRDGRIFYDIYEGEGASGKRINLTYRVSGDTLISDQPSHPNQIKTMYKVENNLILVLEYEGSRTIFTRTPR